MARKKKRSSTKKHPRTPKLREHKASGQGFVELNGVRRYLGVYGRDETSMRPIDIETSGDIWLYRPATHKTSHLERSRVVPLGPRAQGVTESPASLLRPLGSHTLTYGMPFRTCQPAPGPPS